MVYRFARKDKPMLSCRRGLLLKQISCNHEDALISHSYLFND